MNIERDDASEYDQERVFLSQMITNTELLHEVRSILDPELFANDYSQILARWIIRYYDQHNKSPREDMETLFIENRETIRDKDVRKNISILLKRLSKDWEKYDGLNPEYTGKQITKHLRRQSIYKLAEDIVADVDIGDLSAAESRVANYGRIEPLKEGFVNIFKDSEKIHDAFHDEKETLFTLKGDLGKAVGPIYRGELMRLIAPTKAGKTWFKLMCGTDAGLKNLKTVIFNLEVTENMYLRRAFQGLLGAPNRDGIVKLPYLDGHVLKWKEVKRERPEFTHGFIQEKQRKWNLLLKEGGIYLRTFPRGKCTFPDIENELNILRRTEGVDPDLIIVDYADILRSGRRFTGKQDEENFVWESLAALAVERNAAVITSTQGNRQSFDGKTYGVEGLGGYYDKLSHAGKIFSLIVGEEERRKGLCRVQYWYERGDQGDFREVTVLTGFSIGRMYLDSIFSDNLEEEEEDE